MTKVKVGAQFAAVLIADVLNPLFVMSLAIFASAGYLLSLLTPVDIEMWRGLFWVSLVMPGLGLLARFYARWKRGEYIKGGASWRMLLPFIPLLILAHSLIIEFSNPFLQIAAHGELYSGYMQQLLRGATPIENYYAAGHPPDHYWLYFAYVAAVAKIASWPLLYASAIVNFAALFSGLLWLARVVILLRLARPRTIYLGLLVIFVYFSVNASGMLSLLAHLANGANLDLADRSVRSMLLLEGADLRLDSMLARIMTGGSFAMSLAAFCAVLWVCVGMIKGRFGLFSLILISAGGLASAAIQPITALYVVVLLVGLAVTAVIYGLTASNRRALASAFWHNARDRIPLAALGIWLALSLASSLLLLKYIRDFSYNFHAGFELFHPANVSMTGAALALLLPFFLFSVCLCLVKRDALRWFIVISAALALGVTSGLLATNQNQYKGVFLTGILAAFSGLFTLEMMQRSRKGHWRRVGWLLAGMLIALTLTRMIFVNVHTDFSKASGVISRFEYEGLGWRLKRSGKVALAYYWIRDHSPFDSIIVLNPLWHGIHEFSSLLHERMFYVKRAPSGNEHLADGIPGYDERIRDLELFYSEEMTGDEYQKILARMLDSLPGRPIYAALQEGNRWGEGSPEIIEEHGASLVYDGGGVSVYWLNPGAGVIDD